MGKIRFLYILIPIVRKGNKLIPKGQKERKSVTFAIHLCMIWYIEKVSNFEIAVAKLKELLQNVKFATLCRSRSVALAQFSGAQRF